MTAVDDALHYLGVVRGDHPARREADGNPLSFLSTPGLDDPLPAGTQADPTYLAFLRGMGMDQRTAWSTAISHINAIRSQYQTDVSRDPELLRQANERTNTEYGGANFWSGERVAELARNRVADQQRRQDLATGQATAVGNEQTGLQQHLSDLARQNAEAMGALRERQDATNNQDRYIAALAAANHPAGGVTSSTLPGSTPAPGTPPPAPGPAIPHPALWAGLSAEEWLRIKAIRQAMQEAASTYRPTLPGQPPGTPMGGAGQRRDR